MKQGMTRILLILTLLLTLLTPALAQAGEMVVDECGLFSVTEIAQIEELIQDIRDTYQMDAVAMTSRRVPDNKSSTTEEQTQDFADEYFDQNGYGLGEDRAGILYLIDLNNRVLYLSTSGVMIDYINDSRLEKLLDTAYQWAASGNYGQSAIQILKQLKGYLNEGIEEGSFRYDAVTGQRLTGLYNKLTRGETIFAGAVGIAACVIMYLSVAAKYGLKRRTYKFNKDTQSLASYRKDEKTFLRQTVTRTRVPRGGSGGGGGGGGGRGSGVHFSSGGGMHGGGGRHF